MPGAPVEGEVEDIPLTWVAPDGEPTGAALWLTHLGGSTAQTVPMLTTLAGAGLLAVSFEPPGHGRRGTGGPAWDLANDVFAAFRRRMWPLLGRTTLECLRVLDWVDDTFAVPGPWVAGGVSMGGDVTVALAGLDPRVSRVCALVATPDWTRPGMRTLDGAAVVDQGAADAYARWFYAALDPITHLDAYRRDVALSFQCAAADTHVPAEAAGRFRDALVARDPDAARRIRIDLHDGLGHLDGARDERLYTAAMSWLTA